MESNAKYLDRLYRTCMNKVEASSPGGTIKPQQQWLSIFDTIEECGALRIAELLSVAVPQIVVQPSDELSKKICTECLQQLLSFYWFQQMCIQSDKEMHELLSKEQMTLKTPMLEEKIKDELETNDADSESVKDLACSSTLQKIQQPPIQESLPEVTVQIIEEDAAQSSAGDHLEDDTQLLGQCIDAQGKFEEFIKNEPIEDDEANSEYSDGDTMHSAISVIKDELIEPEDQQVNDASLADKSEDKPYECPYCPLRFNTKARMASHKTSHEEAKRHECDICGKEFTKRHSLIQHKLIHSGEKSHKCDICGKRFTHMPSLKIHIRTHTGEKPYKCKYCERRFISISLLINHLRCHLGKNIHRCKLCPLAFPSSAERLVHLTSHKHEDTEVRERNLKALQEEEAKLVLKFSKLSNKEIEQPSTEHLTKHHVIDNEDEPYECPYCPLRFNSKIRMASHKTSHEEAKRHECDICGKGYKTRSSLILHKVIHREERPHKCEICEKRFAQMEHLKVHIRTHTGEKPFKCKYCERRFISSTLLNSHLHIHLGKNIHRCKLCPLAFPSSAEMRLHLTAHKNEDPETRERNLKALQEEEAKLVLKLSEEKSKGESTEYYQQLKLYNKEIEQQSTDSKGNASRHKTSHEGAAKRHECDFCGKKFRIKSDMIIHKRIHTKEKPYKCDLCEQRFARTQQRKAHIRTHFGQDKPFECPYCPLRFSSKSLMAIHKAIHEGIKPHKCSICGKQFLHKSDLKRHKRIHSEEKPHKCHICEKRFTQSQHLIAHIRIHTGDKPYKCKYCERGYVSSTLLNYHLRSHLGKNIHRCKFCPLAVPSYAELRLHLTSHKNEDPEVRERNLKALQEEEAKLVQKFSKEKSKGQATDEQQQKKLSNKEIEQPSIE